MLAVVANRPTNLPAKDRLIVALDVPTIGEALTVVKRLDNVSFFKVGWQLFMTGEILRLLDDLREKNVFVDLKVPGDIGNTVAAVVDACVRFNVKFLTLSESMPPAAIESATKARGNRAYPQFLTVPLLSSLDAGDLARVMASGSQSADDYIVQRAAAAIQAGCDGIIASGQAIARCRKHFGSSAVIVSPGIRPSGSSTDDHKRHTTPEEAIRLGADYLVVGRPIVQSADPRESAAAVLKEIGDALGVLSA
jgi:orotidine-5'-phosphate decarboxylase